MEKRIYDKANRPLTITEAAPRHLDGVEAIEAACFSVPWTREQLERQMNGPNRLFLCAEDENGAPLGYVGLMTVLDEGYISNVAVAPGARRRRTYGCGWNRQRGWRRHPAGSCR